MPCKGKYAKYVIGADFKGKSVLLANTTTKADALKRLKIAKKNELGKKLGYKNFRMKKL